MYEVVLIFEKPYDCKKVVSSVAKSLLVRLRFGIGRLSF